MRRPCPSNFTVLAWILAFVMMIYLAVIVVPAAQAGNHLEKPRARLILEIKDEKLRIFEYETPRMLCHISVMDVSMIGSQATLTCVRKDAPTYRDSLPIEIPLR